jgi:hypothetical protein
MIYRVRLAKIIDTLSIYSSVYSKSDLFEMARDRALESGGSSAA